MPDSGALPALRMGLRRGDQKNQYTERCGQEQISAGAASAVKQDAVEQCRKTGFQPTMPEGLQKSKGAELQYDQRKNHACEEQVDAQTGKGKHAILPQQQEKQIDGNFCQPQPAQHTKQRGVIFHFFQKGRPRRCAQKQGGSAKSRSQRHIYGV